jgi:hypothetical protein
MRIDYQVTQIAKRGSGSTVGRKREKEILSHALSFYLSPNLPLSLSFFLSSLLFTKTTTTESRRIKPPRRIRPRYLHNQLKLPSIHSFVVARCT